MRLTVGIDVGAGAVKCVIMRLPNDDSEEGAQIVSTVSARIRKRIVSDVIDEVFASAISDAQVDELHYVATTGDGEDIPFATGHFYGMTTHARGALFLEPRAIAVLDVGSLHARCVAFDSHGKVLNYKMTSQCASGSGQFLENISRYLGVSQAEIGELSLRAKRPERVSSICAVLAETDVINMVSRGISTEDILRGIHESMAGRFARLMLSLINEGVAFVSGGLAGDIGLIQATKDAIDEQGKRKKANIELSTHPQSIFAGAIGAAIWGGFRHRKLGLGGSAWQAKANTTTS